MMVARGTRRKAPVEATEAGDRLSVEAAQKDRALFAELYEINFESVYAFIARRIGDHTEVEDLTSDVFQRALAALARFEWRGVPFAAWLLKIAANAIADRSKRAAQERDVPALDGPRRSISRKWNSARASSAWSSSYLPTSVA